MLTNCSLTRRGQRSKNSKTAKTNLSSVNECEPFTLGFRLGARFMLEVMEDLDIPFIGE